MKFEKASQKLVDFFNKIAPNEKDGVDVKKMFGYPCRFVNGNMFTGLHENNMVLRLSENDRENFLKLENTKQFKPMPNRVMKEYVVIPPQMISNENLIKPWLKLSLNYAKSLPKK